jgi:hypothetical protein
MKLPMFAALLAVALQTVVGWIVSIRLLALARRTRAWPERLLGLSLFLAVALGYPMRIVGPRLGSAALDWLGNAGVSLGFALFAVFVCSVFRSGIFWARALAALLGVGFAAQCAYLSFAVEPLDATFVQMVLAVLTYGWGALEAVSRARMQSRQLALGLGDPQVHARLWLFALLGASVVLGALANAAAVAAGWIALEEPVVLLATTLSGTTFATSALLAFAPPDFYRRRSAAGSLRSARR